MELDELLTPERVALGIEASSKKQALEALARFAAADAGLEPRDVFETLLERERLGSTGVGRGVAIPHGKPGGLDAIRGYFVRLAAPVDFDAVDGEPVDLLFLLLAPEGAGADHLRALARVSRLLRDEVLCETLRLADDRRAVLAALGLGERSAAA